MTIVAAVYRIAVAFWAGGVGLFTFVLTPIIFRTQTRDVAGQIVGTLFPGYFRWGLAWGGIALLSLAIIRGKHLLPVILLIGMLGLTSFQAFYIEPRATELKKQIPSFETTPKDHPLRRQFSRLHAVSAACNLAVFTGGAILIVLL